MNAEVTDLTRTEDQTETPPSVEMEQAEVVLCRTPQEALEAGRRHARERGDRLTDEQVVRLAALVRPYLLAGDAESA